jgi:hypothetical protein
MTISPGCREVYPTIRWTGAGSGFTRIDGIAELHRSISELGLHGVMITSQVDGISLDTAALYDFMN